jgi:3-oxoadipate enol-lactonase
MLPIILVHGFPLDASMWKNQAEYLRSRGHTVITPNLPGFGGTPHLPREGSSMQSFADEVHRVILQHGGRAIVGGFSMGGYVLLALLRQHRESVGAAMFIDTRAEADAPAARETRLQSVEEITRTGSTSGIVETMLGKVMGKRPAPGVKEQVRAIMERQPPEAVMHAQLAMATRRDETELLATLTMPVLIVVGAEDAIAPPSVALAMQSHMTHAMVAQIVSAGHMAPMEQSAAVNTAIETFLATVHEPAPAASRA